MAHATAEAAISSLDVEGLYVTAEEQIFQTSPNLAPSSPVYRQKIRAIHPMTRELCKQSLIR